MSHHRDELCEAIAKLSGATGFEVISDVLDPFFQDSIELPHTDSSGGISPLMVACDKGSAICLKYLEAKYCANEAFAQLIGSPSEQSTSDGNTPLHFAAVSGNEDIINVLSRLDGNVLNLGALCNSHGDSPLMMAALHGNAAFLQRWIDLAGETDPGSMKNLLSCTNLSGDSCISLACCHGHPTIVAMLIALGVGMTNDEMAKCRGLGELLNKNPSLLEQHKEKIQGVKDSIKLLEQELQKRSDEAVNQLLLVDAEELAAPTTHKKKQKKRGRRGRAGQATRDVAREASPKEVIDADGSDKLKLTPLSNGAMAVSVDSGAFDKQTQDPILGRPDIPSHSADELFRQRFEGSSSDLEAVMDSLCLDVSMLLYTPHGMALNLSPSQLDAIHGILAKQLTSVEEAREIQQRLHDTTAN